MQKKGFQDELELHINICLQSINQGFASKWPRITQNFQTSYSDDKYSIKEPNLVKIR